MSDYYIDPQTGFNVKTAKAHLKKGSCCKCGCLHCPYGYTLNKFGLEVKKYNDQDRDLAKEIFDAHKNTTTQSLLSSAFGNQSKKSLDQYHFIYLKGYLCGLCLIQGKIVTELLLHENFNSQGINKSIIENYL